MKEILVSEKNALLETKNDYIVAVGYDRETQTWAHGHYFCFWQDETLKPISLRNATEYFLRVDMFDNEYINRYRMEKIATTAIHYLDELGLYYLMNDTQMEAYEVEYFGIKESEIK